jgi:hypothetical protein
MLCRSKDNLCENLALSEKEQDKLENINKISTQIWEIFDHSVVMHLTS